MFTSIGEGIKGLVINLIKIALLIAVLFAVINWAKNNPEVAQRMFTQVANAVASLVTWASNEVIQVTS